MTINFEDTFNGSSGEAVTDLEGTRSETRSATVRPLGTIILVQEHTSKQIEIQVNTEEVLE